METRIPIEVDGHTGYIYKQRNTSCWSVDFTSSKGRRYRRSLGTDDQKKAAEQARQLIGRKVCPAYSYRNATVKEAVKKYLEYWSPEIHRPATTRRFTQVLEDLMKRVGPDIPLRLVSRDDIFKWRNDKKREWVLDRDKRPIRQVSPHTVNNILVHLRAFFKWALAEQMIDRDPMFKIPILKTPRVGKRAPTVAEVSMLIKAAKDLGDEYMVAWITVANATGLRPSEQTHIRGVDLHVFEKHLSVTPYDQWVPKDYEQRIVVVDDDAVPILAKRLEEQEDKELPLFAGRGELIRDVHYVSKLFRAVAVKAKLKYTLYDLRHAYATRKVAQGVELQWLMCQLGHSTPETLIRWYLDRRHVQGSIRQPQFGASAVDQSKAL